MKPCRTLNAGEVMYKAFALSVIAVIVTIGVSVAVVAWRAVHLLDAATTTFEAINRPCVKGKPCGTLADVNQTLGTVRGTFGQVEAAARHENRQLTTLDAQEKQVFDGLNGAITEARGTLSAASGFVSKATTSLNGVDATLGAARGTLGSITADGQALQDRINDPEIDALLTATRRRISDPQIDALIGNLRDTTGNVAGITGSLNKMGAHIEKKVDAPPTWKSRAEATGIPALKLLIWYFTK